MPRRRLFDIDRATGFAMFLVVMGHLATCATKDGAEWYCYLKEVLYTFHMAFFMYLSGTIMYYTYKPIENTQEYMAYVFKKFMRFIPAYLFFTVIVFVGKIIFVRFLYVDNPVESWTSYFKVLYAPHDSFGGFLWYIYVLFELYFLVPLLLMLFRRIELLLLIATFVHFLHFPRIMALNLIGEYLIYFSIGGVCAKNYSAYVRYLDKFGWIFLVLFLAEVICCHYILLYQLVPYNIAKTLMGLLSIPAIHYLVRTSLVDRLKFLYDFAIYSFPIYLMNVIVIGIVKGFFFKLCSWDNSKLLFIAPFLIISGLYIPIWTKKYVLKYIWPLNKIIY